MSTFCRKVVNVALLVILFLAFAAFIIVTFFTNDKVIKYTIAKVPTSITKCNGLEKPVDNTVVHENSNSEVATFKETNLPVTYGNKEKSVAEVSSRSATIVSTNENKKTNQTQTAPTNSAPKSSGTAVQSNYKSYNSVGRVQIPKTGVDLPILSDISVGGMETGACIVYSTGSLNQTGNTLIATHNYKNGKLFSNNYKLAVGDVIYITSLDGKKIKYVIYDKFITNPQDLSYIKRNSDSKPGIALSCCTDDEQNRIVILAKSEL